MECERIERKWSEVRDRQGHFGRRKGNCKVEVIGLKCEYVKMSHFCLFDICCLSFHLISPLSLPRLRFPKFKSFPEPSLTHKPSDTALHPNILTRLTSPTESKPGLEVIFASRIGLDTLGHFEEKTFFSLAFWWQILSYCHLWSNYNMRLQHTCEIIANLPGRLHLSSSTFKCFVNQSES